MSLVPQTVLSLEETRQLRESARVRPKSRGQEKTMLVQRTVVLQQQVIQATKKMQKRAQALNVRQQTRKVGRSGWTEQI